jgi:hypothetical protein
MITQIRFERIGTKTNLPIVQIASTDFNEVFRVIEHEVGKEGFLVHKLSYRWNVDGDDRCYVLSFPTNNVVAVFRMDNVRPHK